MSMPIARSASASDGVSRARDAARRSARSSARAESTVTPRSRRSRAGGVVVRQQRPQQVLGADEA
jgi:hypothetical protein